MLLFTQAVKVRDYPLSELTYSDQNYLYLSTSETPGLR